MNILNRVKQSDDDRQPEKRKHHGQWTTINDAIKEAEERARATDSAQGKEEKAVPKS